MAEKPFEKITITDIVNRADINRGTFYAHYSSTTEVLRKIQSDAINELKIIFESMDYKNFFNDSEKTLKEISDFLKKDFEYYKMLLIIDGGKGFVSSWKESLVGFFSGVSFLNNQNVKTSEVHCAINFVINGLADAYLDILLGKSKITLEDAPRLLSSIVKRVMEPYL